MKPTAANVRKMLGRNWGTWGEFKHALVRHQIIPSFYADCPREWIVAYRAFCQRTVTGPAT